MKIALILRGVPGSGKSTFAQNLKNRSPAGSVAIHSTNSFFMVNEHYHFDAEELREHHKKNLSAFENSLDKGVKTVICDNTSSQSWEYEIYIMEALAREYQVKILFFPHPLPKAAAWRNVHGVPLDAIERMIARFEKDEREITYSHDIKIVDENE